MENSDFGILALTELAHLGFFGDFIVLSLGVHKVSFLKNSAFSIFLRFQYIFQDCSWANKSKVL